MPKLSDHDSIEDLRASFISITDSTKSSITSIEDLTKALQRCGRNPSIKQVEHFWRTYREQVNIEDFIKIASNIEKINEKELLEAFKAIDNDRNGYISTKELQNLFSSIGEPMTSKEIREIMKEADLNNDGKLDYREFIKVFIDTIQKVKETVVKTSKKKDLSLPTLPSFDDFDLKARSKDSRIKKDDIIDSARRNVSSRNHRRDDSDDERPKNRNNHRENSDDRLRGKNRHGDYSDDDRPKEKSRNDSRDDLGYKPKTKNRYRDESDDDKPRNRDRHGDYSGDDMKKERDRNSHRNSDDDRKKDRNSHRDNSDDRLRNKNRYRGESDDERKKDTYRNSHRGNLSDRSKHSLDQSLNSSRLEKKNGRPIQLFEQKHKALSSIRDDFSEPRNLRRWETKTIKGGFYFNEALNGIVSNSFALDLDRESSVFISIESFTTDLHEGIDWEDLDASVLVVKNSSNLILKGLTENKIDKKWCAKLDLTPGRYFLFPFTSGCHLKRRNVATSRNSVDFFKFDSRNKRTLSRPFKDALSVIFDLCDLDSNGKLNQEELNLYTFLTANENLSEEEWRFVGDTVGFERDELTKDGFIELSKIEASREDTDIEDIAMRINNMGFNRSLKIDQSIPYALNVSCENSPFDLLIGEIYKLKAAEKFLSQLIEKKGIPNETKNFTLYEYSNNYLSYVEIQNQTKNQLDIDVDFTKSENCIANNSELYINLKVKPNKSKIAMILTSKNPRKDWTTKCNIISDSKVSANRYD